ncbi:mannonate dehydratase [Rhodobacteraceae bacterium nBUS_22]|tara:strand:- start:1566 stop:2750 length:1185 start_codon:yes stop_codon:yes gene_type:complete
MKETWRWYGEDLDKIQLSEIRQTGATGIVTALHEVPYGEVWSREAIATRRDQITVAGMDWSVCESLPVHEDIKRGTGNLTKLFANYRQSLANLAIEGVNTICYNFMPILDWTRTDLSAPVVTGGTCLRFSATKMAAFEIHMLGRKEAESDYPQSVVQNARKWFEASTEGDRTTLLNAIMAGMPGAFDRYDVIGLQRALDSYQCIGKQDILKNLKRFLDEVIPTAEDLGMRLCVHPDDPPRDILGLPRIVSDAEDIEWILSAHDTTANGLTLCTGSLGANPNNDIPAIAHRHADRINFAHLRNVQKDPDGSFEEAAHLDGDTNMVAVCKVLVDEERSRRLAGRRDHEIPFRPDHGHDLLSDMDRKTFPGYPIIGRMRGLAEVRGILHALNHDLRS